MPRLLVLVVAALAAGCGLIDEDVTRFELGFPQHDFRVESADWQILGNNLPSIGCAQVTCEEASGSFCGEGRCQTSCDETSQMCRAVVPIVLVNDYNLAVEAAEYQAIADQPIVTVEIDEISFVISENTLTVDTPPLAVYFGPSSATAPGDSGVQLVGTVPAVTAGSVGRSDISFEPNGRAVMQSYLLNFKTPFRVLVSGEIALRGGDPVPMGRLVGAVHASVTAGL